MYAATANTAPAPWGARHLRLCAGVRIAAGTWNVVIASLLVSHGHAWGSVFFVTAALIFVAAYAFARRNSAFLRNGQS
jgi:hypothetical protein